MRAHRLLILIAAMACVGLCRLGFAQEAGAKPGEASAATKADEGKSAADRERFERNKERWEKMSPEERERMKKRFEEWKKLTPEERERIEKNYHRFRQMPPEKREELMRLKPHAGQVPRGRMSQMRERFHRFQELPPEKRKEIMEKMRAIHDLFRDDFERLKTMPPDSEEARKLASELRMKAFVLHMSPPQTLERLKELDPEQREKALGKLMEENRQKMEAFRTRMEEMRKQRGDGPPGPPGLREHRDGPRLRQGPPRPRPGGPGPELKSAPRPADDSKAE